MGVNPTARYVAQVRFIPLPCACAGKRRTVCAEGFDAPPRLDQALTLRMLEREERTAECRRCAHPVRCHAYLGETTVQRLKPSPGSLQWRIDPTTGKFQRAAKDEEDE